MKLLPPAGRPLPSDIARQALEANAAGKPAQVAAPTAIEAIRQRQQLGLQPLGLPLPDVRVVDPLAAIPAEAAALATPQLAAEARDALLALAETSDDPELASLCREASGAVRRAAKAAEAEAEHRLARAQDPVVLSGRIDRRMRKHGQQVLFRPADPAVAPFPILPAAVEGLPSGGRISLKLARAEHGGVEHQIAPATEKVRTLLAEVVEEGGARWLEPRGSCPVYGRLPLVDAGGAKPGELVLARVDAVEGGFSARVKERLGDRQSLSAAFLEAAVEQGVRLDFPAAVLEELAAIQKDPGITGPDLTHIPFVTIDDASTRDLDQALAVERRQDGGYTVHYAIADAAHFVKPGSALDREAQKRAFTTYLPDRSIPMLPRELTEDLCSLVAGQRRRAFVVSMEVSPKGELEDSRFARGVVLCRAKLAFEDVQGFAAGDSALAAKDFTPSLAALAELGGLRVKDAIGRGVVQSREPEERVGEDPARPGAFVVKKRERLDVELWNEQISLLANEAVGRFVEQAGAKVLHRTLAEPEPALIEGFREKVASLGQPWKQGSLAEYIDRLDPADAKTRPILRMAARLNRAAKYHPEPRGHAALKLDSYVHFTAPMRRYPDILAARVLAALVEGTAVPHQDEAELLAHADRIAAAARRCGTVEGQCLALAKARILTESAEAPKTGTVIHVCPQGIDVELGPGTGVVRVPTASLQRAAGGPWQLAEAGVSLEGPGGRFRLGDEITLAIHAKDPEHDVVELVPTQLERGERRAAG